MGLEHQCNCARYHSSCHGSSAQGEVMNLFYLSPPGLSVIRWVHTVLREKIEQVVVIWAGICDRFHAVTGGDQVRFGEEIDGCRSARTVVRDGIVRAEGRSKRLRRTDSDHLRIVTGARDAAVHYLSKFIFTKVAGCDDNHNAGSDSGLTRLREGIRPVRLRNRMPEGKINDSNVVFGFVLNHPLDSLDDITCIP